MNHSNTQDHLFRIIRDKLQEDQSLPDRIAEILFISTDSAYRRIRGETPLVLEEVKILCQAFDISFDNLLGSHSEMVCFYPVRVEDNVSFEVFLDDIKERLSEIKNSKEAEIICQTHDLTLFHSFYEKPLFAFKYFFWMKSVLRDPQFSQKLFHPDILPSHVEEKGKSILGVYNSIPSVEIWSSECVNSTISQVEYYREAGYITVNDASLIYLSIEKTVEHIKRQAEEGAKFMPGEEAGLKKNNYQLFYNRVLLGGNSFLVSQGSKMTLYLNYELLNYLVIQDHKFCNDVHENIKALIKRSTMLSENSERQRNKFFNILMRKVPNFKITG